MLVAVVLVSAEMAAAIEVEAVVTFAAVASDPEVRVASVRLRVAKPQTPAAVKPFELVASCRPIEPGVVRDEEATFHTSAASVPNEVSVRVELAQTAVGMVARSEVDAVRTVALVFALIAV